MGTTKNMFSAASAMKVLLLSILPSISAAQFTYTLDQSIPVEVDGRTISLAWSGGLNSVQISTMDFDGDGTQDIVAFDRAADKILPFRKTTTGYEYKPDYQILFPEAVTQWMLLRDINCDGKKDLFTSDPFGIAVFVNTTKPGQALSWRPFNPGFPLLTKGFSSNINLKINDVDIPAVDDVDNDGDLDVLSLRFVGIGTIEWHKNMSMERSGTCDSLQLERVTQAYGGVEECACGVFAFGGEKCPVSGRVQHVGGKALLTLDTDNDGDRELLYAEETCAPLYIMTNSGKKEAPVFTKATPFPSGSPASFPLFPAPFLEDVDGDGLSDLVVSPNLYSRQNTFQLVKESVWLYKNTGTQTQPQFTFMQPDFLQGEMIEVGDYSIPALIDADNDGDEDLFIGSFADDRSRGRIWNFENVGTAAEASFRLVTDDFGGLSALPIYNIKPQFADMNGDGTIDLAFTATVLNTGATNLFFVPNRSEEILNLNFGAIEQTAFRIGFGENARVVDLNRDGKADVLLGKATGALQYWMNKAGGGSFDQMTMQSGSFLGLGNSTSRQNPAVAFGDLDADGQEDMVVADQRGNIYLYGDFRTFDPTVSQPVSDVLYNGVSKEYMSNNFGGRVWPVIGNLFNSNKPAIVLGNTLGGLYVLRNDDGAQLPPEPVVGIGPNPLRQSEELLVRSDRNTRVQIFSLLGQKMSEQISIQANQEYPLSLKNLAAGMYVARFRFPGKTISVKFVLQEPR